MSLTAWLTLCGVCLAGAMSPGPSLAVVMQCSLGAGRRAAVFVAVSHGAGIFVWAMLTAGGIGLVFASWPEIYDLLRWLGCLFLVYLGVRNLMSGLGLQGADPFEKRPPGSPIIDGFLIAVTNPKIALFFLALFSQFVRVDAAMSEKILMATTAAVIDALWYSAVAILFSNTLITDRLIRNRITIDRVFGVILIFFAAYVFAVDF